jgi:hypothetical protein
MLQRCDVNEIISLNQDFQDSGIIRIKELHHPNKSIFNLRLSMFNFF